MSLENVMFAGSMAGAVGTGLLGAINSVVATDSLQTLIAILVGLFFGLVFAFVAVLLTWLLSFCITGTNKEFSEGDEEELGFDENEIDDPVHITLGAAGAVVINLIEVVVSATQTAGSVVADNFILLLLFLLVFGAIFVWTAWHDVIIEAIVLPYNCFLAPIVRTFVLPLVETFLFAIGSFVVPPLNLLRRVFEELTVTWILRAIGCAFSEFRIAITNLGLVFRLFAIATVNWLRVDVGANGNGQSPIVVGPDYTMAFEQLGTTISGARGIFTCACEPLDEPLFEPLFGRFESPPFARGLNATTGAAVAAVTQTLVRPIVQSIQNAQNAPDDTLLSEIIVRPNFNATIDLAVVALNSGAEFVDCYIPAFYVSLRDLLIDLTDLPLPTDVVPPDRSLITLTMVAPLNVFILQPTKVGLNFLVNIDQVFTDAENGLFFWRLTDAFDAAREYATVATNVTTFFSDWLRALGDNVTSALRAPIGSDASVLGDVVPPLTKRVFVDTSNDGNALPTLMVYDQAKVPDAVILQLQNHVNGSKPTQASNVRELQLEGELLELALDFLADFIDRLACYIPTGVESAIQIVKVLTEIPVGTVYRSISSFGEFEIGGTPIPNLLLFSQEYFGDFGQSQCSVFNVPPNDGTINLFTIERRDCIVDNAISGLCATAASGDVIDVNNPDFIVAPSVEDLQRLAAQCVNPPFPTFQCSPVVTQVTGPGGQPLIENQWKTFVEAQVEFVRCTSRVASAICTVCGDVESSGDRLSDALVALILVPIDFIVHIDRVFSTVYIGECIDYDAIFDALTDFVLVFSNIIRTIGNNIADQQQCPTITAPSFSLENRSSFLFCCLANGIDAAAGTLIEGSKQVVAVFRSVVLLIADVSGGGQAGITDTDVTDILDTISFDSTFEAAEALVFDVYCLPLQLIPDSLVCSKENDTDPDTPVRDVLTKAFGKITAEVLFLIPRTLLETTLALVKAFEEIAVGGDEATAIEEVIVAFGQPILDVVVDFFDELGNIFLCIDAESAIGNSFKAIATFLQEVGEEVFQIITDLVLLVVQLVFGIIELLAETCPEEDQPCTDILEGALDTLVRVVLRLAFFIFGNGFVCGIQDAVCFFSSTATTQAVIDVCVEEDFDFTFCAVQPDRPSGFFCEVTDPTTCTFGGCPSVPYGCCGDAAFPELNSAEGLIELLDEGDARDSSCSPWVGVADDDDDDGTSQATACQTLVGLTEPYNTFFFDDSTNARLACSFGQSADQGCDLFESITECDRDNVVFVTRDTELRRKRSVYDTDNSERHNGAVLSAEFCANFLETFGIKQARELTERTKYSRSLANLDDRTAHRCYTGMIQDSEAKTFMQLQAERYERLDQRLKTTFSSKMSDGIVKAYQRNKRIGIQMYESQRFKIAVKKKHVSRLSNPRIGTTIANMGVILQRASEQRVAIDKHHGLQSHGRGHRPATQAFLKRMSARFASHNTKMLEHYRDTTIMASAIAASLHLADVIEHAPARVYAVTSAGKRKAGQLVNRVTNSPFTDGKSVMTYAAKGLQKYAKDSIYKTSVAFGNAFAKLVKVRQRTARQKVLARAQKAAKAGRVFESTDVPHLHRKPLTPKQLRNNAKQWHQHLHQHSTHSGAIVLSGGFDSLEFDEDILPPTFSERECDDNVQLFCTQCAIIDDAVFTIETGINRTVDFYTETGSGFDSLVDQLDTRIENTLLDPIGTDTWTTNPKTTPFIGDRLLTVRWFWQWDYTEFVNIIQNNDSNGEPDIDDLVDQTIVESRAAAAEQGRDDLDNELYEAFEPIVLPLTNALESTVSAVQQTGSLQTATRLFERYVRCDYDNALFCNSDLGIGLFDGFLNAALIFALLSAILTLLPGGSILAMALSAPTLYYLTLWIAYGASPLCTLPQIFTMVPGVPTCLPSDVSQLAAEIVPQCAPQPIGLIDPAFQDRASSELCGICPAEDGPIPLLSCGRAAGFLDGFDNLFYTLGVLFDRDVVLFIGESLETTVPRAAEAALRYSPEYIAELDSRQSIGAICNVITFGNVLALFVILSFASAFAILLLVTSFTLVLGILIFIYLAFYAANRMWQQQYSGYVVRYIGKQKQKVE